ncbi:hypothetical protein T265_08940 [Opisthorchis viverrini]|uniref:Uncharacterized protein n=1 Tax=Opisthorchis viverrini TaxID=6198 RepID=A0A074Z7C2_OPIVI|nr:hypothetical protein T265_08940 [Opisthorchis viverrini]KER23086.1 hypothetical protein T265_08940 [Opisthorchis viverrini]
MMLPVLFKLIWFSVSKTEKNDSDTDDTLRGKLRKRSKNNRELLPFGEEIHRSRFKTETGENADIFVHGENEEQTPFLKDLPQLIHSIALLQPHPHPRHETIFCLDHLALDRSGKVHRTNAENPRVHVLLCCFLPHHQNPKRTPSIHLLLTSRHRFLSTRPSPSVSAYLTTLYHHVDPLISEVLPSSEIHCCHGKNRSAVAPFRCLTAMPPEGSTRDRILPGCPSLDKGSREAEVGGCHGKNRSAVAPFRCLTAMPPEGSTRDRILPGCPSLDKGSREAEVGFEPRNFRQIGIEESGFEERQMSEPLDANWFVQQLPCLVLWKTDKNVLFRVREKKEFVTAIAPLRSIGIGRFR